MTIEKSFLVLHDIFEERGVSWECRLVLLEMLRLAENVDGNHDSISTGPVTRRCFPGYPAAHIPSCVLGAALRAVGGEEERQRQCDDAHLEALEQVERLKGYPRDFERDRMVEEFQGKTLDGNELAKLKTTLYRRDADHDH